MVDLPFPILGTDIPPMLGRTRIMQRMWSDLTKQTPSHLQIVGPRYAGKTVLMHGLAKLMVQEDSPYAAVIVWDLGHQTPDSNEAFLKALCDKLGEGLKASGNDYGDHLLAVEDDEYNELRDVLDALHDDESKVLMLWDGFDKPLSTGKLTRNLWDQLRELASSPSLRLVTATRRPLAELIRSEESVASDFWNIFDMTPVRVDIFDEDDRATILARLPGYTFKSGALSELENWSAGYPPLYLTLLNHIIESGAAGEIDNQAVNNAAEATLDGVSGVLNYLWNDCPETAKNLYRYLVEHSEIAVSDVGISERTLLMKKGFIKVSGNRISKGCRLLEQHIKSLGKDAGSMVRLFGPWEAYRSNIRGLLELRLAQINQFDERLPRYVEFSIKRLPEDPASALNDLTSIEERGLDLIWEREFGAVRLVPSDIVAYWTVSPRDRNYFIQDMMKTNSFEVPLDRFQQLRLLQLLTGSTKDFESKSKTVSKDSYVLLNAIHCFRNRNQHGGGQETHLGVAVAAIMTCMELLACLDRESGV
ncbi:MAG: hypothetical protein PHZ02_00665 [Desulfocapsaceae bacterium]|nr:hypothetical protein [Desulfocapsaceae bacterium]